MTPPREPSAPHPTVVFAHGNSFPGGTYGVLFRGLRARGYTVKALDRFGHDPRYPVTSNWPHLVQQLADFVQAECADAPGPLYLVGHSLGGFVSLMCAARHPQLAGRPLAGVVMLDSPVLGGWRAKALQAVKQTRLIGALSPGQVSRKRRNRWPSAADALAHFAHKRSFAAWDPQVLQDYIAHGTQDEVTPQGVQRVLRFDRDVETAIYNTLPHHLDRLLRRHPLACPVAFVGGTRSAEMQQVGMAMTYQLVGREPSARLQMVEGSHLFPMERPLDTAAAIDRALRSFAG
ncbi:alpha/beta hydrolase [Aquabacterium sp. A08]|uniref:alpha/beta hydrolase n=1 Tax=Aquabacterium sp. A08 TaxID=2718532 RepID=UPI00141D8582|nr:alpha/beta hydrolase [Aquabacterium sp. A08]NIC41116.1 alpha/beta hydrolase [Aquabacterium sp. A08]NIC41141.1 alpha/beta hydrolase [Aquabacterium sp. A08]